MTAIADKDQITAKLLIDKGADVNEKNDKGWTELMFASALGLTDTVQALVDKGVNVNEKETSGCTALHFAAIMGSLESAKVLIKAGADVNIRDNNGQTAYLIAASKRNTDFIRILSESGSDEVKVIEKTYDLGGSALTIYGIVKTDNGDVIASRLDIFNLNLLGNSDYPFFGVGVTTTELIQKMYGKDAAVLIHIFIGDSGKGWYVSSGGKGIHTWVEPEVWGTVMQCLGKQ